MTDQDNINAGIKRTDFQIDQSKVKKEIKRLKKAYVGQDGAITATIQGLIERAAFLRVSIDAAEADIAENGYTEPFQQTLSVAPYMRVRPIATQYNSMLGSYNKVIKALLAALPSSTQDNDALLDFLQGK